ncbi:hypothetical protein AGMMS50230_15020 [Spirochaetia bacterium]|nr:hypothetical protein AGMMS50230_15020 [Spirochaetia bacterium]
MDTRTKRLVFVELLIFLTLAGTTALLFRPLMAVINRHITIVREGLVGEGEKFLNRPIRYSSLSPSLIGMVEIRDLTIGEETKALMRVERFYLEYSFLDLLRGRGAGVIRNLILEGPSLFFDVYRDSDLRSLFSRKGGKIFLPPECQVVLRNGSLSLSRGRTVLAVTGIFLDGEIKDGRIRAEGSWQKTPAAAGISIGGQIHGDVSDQFDDGMVRISIDSIEGRGFALEKQVFSVSFSRDSIFFERDKDGLALELSARYRFDNGDLSLSFSAEKLLLRNMVRFFGPLEKAKAALGLSLSGNASLLMNKDTASALVYRFDLNAEHEHKQESASAHVPLRGFVLVGNGDRERLVFSRFNVEAGRGFASYEGDLVFNPFMPRGRMVFSDFTFTGSGDLNGTLNFSPGGVNRLYLGSPYFSIGELVLSSIAGTLSWEKTRALYEIGFERQGKTGSFTSSGTYTLAVPGKPPQLEGRAALNDFPLTALLDMARPFVTLAAPGKMTQQAVLSMELLFVTDFTLLSYQTSRFSAALGSSLTVDASITGTEHDLSVSGGELRWRRGFAEFSLETDFSAYGSAVFSFQFSYLNFDYWLEGRYGNNTLAVWGPDNLSVRLEKEEDVWSGSAEAFGVAVPGRKRSTYLTFVSSLVYRSASSWDLLISRLELRGLRGRSQTGFFVHGAANQNGLNLDRIYYADQTVPLEGSAAAVWDTGFSVIDGSFVLKNGETETLSGDLFFEGGVLDFSGRASSFRLDRFMDNNNELKLTADLTGRFTNAEQYTVNIGLEALSGRAGDKTFSLGGRGLLDPERLLLSQLKLSAGELETEIPYLSVDRSAGRLETESRITGKVNDQYLGANLALGMNFRPGKNWLDLETTSFSGIIDVRRAYINDIAAPEPFAFVFTRIPSGENGEGMFRLSGGPGDMLHLEFRERSLLNGVITASLAAPSPVQGTIAGTLEKTFIDVWASGVFIDLESLWKIIPVNKVINFTGGFLSGETRLYGSIFDPEFAGTAWGSGVFLTVPQYVKEKIGPGTGLITLEGNEISFGPVAAPCGSGGGRVSGWIRLNRWIPSFNLDIEVDRSIPFDFDLSGVLASGNATGNLNLLMENKEIMTITGNLNANDTEITINPDEMNNARSTDMDIITDIYIKAGRRVEFIWPDPRTPVLRAYGEMGTGVRITGDTRIPHFSMDGDVVLRGGEVLQLQRNFYIREGVLRFNGNEPQIDPRISVRAELRDRNEDGPVTITMVIDNVPLSAIRPNGQTQMYIPRFESSPSLSQLEIYSLLGQAPSAGETPTARPVLNFGTEVILQTLVFHQAERLIRNTLGLDMFSFRTQFLQNAIYEAVRTREPDEPERRPATVGTYLDNTTIFAGKYLSPDLFLQGMFTFRYDEYQVQYGGIRVEPELGLDFRTPLFDIRWNLRPKYEEYFYTGQLSDPVAGYVSGQSITLIWRWSL